MVKRGDRLKYLRYKCIIIDPTGLILNLIMILATCTFALSPSSNSFAYLVITICSTNCVLIVSKRHKRVNDYLILEKVPFSHCYAIYQDVKRKRTCTCFDFVTKRTAYLNQMRDVLGQLPPGRYKTITQPMFTRAILKCSRVTMIKQEKAYRKRIDTLMQQVYPLGAFPKHSSYTQFYYLIFELDK